MYPGEHVAWHPFATRIDGDHTLGAVRTCTVQIGRKPGTTRERCTSYHEANTIMWAGAVVLHGPHDRVQPGRVAPATTRRTRSCGPWSTTAPASHGWRGPRRPASPPRARNPTA